MEFELGQYRVEVATDFGPRVTGLWMGSGPNVMAVLPTALTVGEGPHRYRFHGGHRIWAAPEVPEVTYSPDEHACVVTEMGGLITVKAPPDLAGIVKEMSIRLTGDWLSVSNGLAVTRELSGEIAPWAITQLPGEGLAILPLGDEQTAPLPNRQIVLWPYTSISDPRLAFTDHAVLVTAAAGSNLKLGVGPDPRRLGYWHRGQLFVKELDPANGRRHPDLGARAQVFVGAGFCELETVGALASAGAGATFATVERWRISQCDDLDAAITLTVAGP